MNLKFIETFVVAAKLGSFSKTAERMHTTLAAISSRIQSLEEEVGGSLFDRTGRRLRITERGLALLPMAERLAIVAQEFELQARSPDTFVGRVRMGMIDTAAMALLPMFLREVEQRYPNVEIDLHADTSHRIADRMSAGEIDIGITLVGESAPGAIRLHLLNLACHWVASPSLAEMRAEMSLEELARHAILSFAHESIPHQHVQAIFASVGGPRRMYCGTSLATMLGLAKGGLGVAVMPAALIEDELAAASLRLVPFRTPVPPLRIQVSYFDTPGQGLHKALVDVLADVANTYCARIPTSWAWTAGSAQENLD